MMNEQGPYGATPGEWAFWSKTLGLESELLPTVCNPYAKISPNSVLKSGAKVPSRYTTQREIVGIPKWNEGEASHYEIDRWGKEPDYGICLQMRKIQCFDVDVNSPGFVKIIDEVLGIYEMPRRWRSNSEKCLYLFRPETPSKKRVLKMMDFVDPDDGSIKPQMIEMLGLGNQCLVAGRHPSGVHYQWDTFSTIPELNDTQVQELLDEMRAKVGSKDWSRGARVPKNVNDPDYEKRLKTLKAAKAEILSHATPAPVMEYGAVPYTLPPAGVVMNEGVTPLKSTLPQIEWVDDGGDTWVGSGLFEPLYADDDTALTVPRKDAVSVGKMLLDEMETLGSQFASDDAKLAAIDEEIRRSEQYAALGPDPVVDYLTEHGFVKGEGEGGKLYVVCPFESAHGKQHADDSQTCYLPAGTGGYFRGHVDCKDGSCDAYEDWQFLVAWGLTQYHPLAGFAAVPYTEEELQRAAEVRRMNAPLREQATVLNALGVDTTATPEGSPNPLDAPHYDRDKKKGEIRVHQNNITTFCSYPSECGYRFEKDTFRNKIYATRVDGPAPCPPVEVDDDLLTDVVMRARTKGMGPGTVPRDQLSFAISLAATKFDSAIQWITSLPVWDRTPRVETFCIQYLGCEDTPYHRAVGLYWWSAMAGRLLSVHGIQADMVPILIGDQGSGKSSTVRALVPDAEHYVSLSFHTPQQELTLKMFGKLVGELAELSGLKGKDMESTKEWLTTIKDSARIVYERFPRTYPRRLVFVGTTNRDDFATDTTGNRRLLPVRVGTVQDVAAIIRDRNQLWAEAKYIFEHHGIQWKDADILARDEHCSVMAPLPSETRIAAWLTHSQTILTTNDGIEGLTWGELPYLTIVDVAMGALQATAVQATQGQLPHQVCDVLKKFGYSCKQIRIDNRKVRVWVRPGVTGSVEIADWKRTHEARAKK